MAVLWPILLRPSQCRMQALASVYTGAIFCMYGLTATFRYITYSECGWGCGGREAVMGASGIFPWSSGICLFVKGGYFTCIDFCHFRCGCGFLSHWLWFSCHLLHSVSSVAWPRQHEEMLYMYSQKDLLILHVHLVVLLVVTLTVPVVLFPVRGGRVGPREQSDGIRGSGSMGVGV